MCLPLGLGCVEPIVSNGTARAFTRSFRDRVDDVG